MTRKTVNVQDLKNTVNSVLSNMEGNNVEYRRGMMTILEDVLHSTGNYRGFKYLTRRDLPVGVVPGIETELDGSFIVDDYDRQFKDTDSTRVVYL